MPTGAVAEGRSLDDTVMRWKDPTNTSARRLLQTGHAHPYYANELLHKVSANITNRSNVFAVWLTVGFFEVVDDPSTGRVNLLGEEIGRRDGREVRPRFFSIVDRSQLVISPKTPLTVGQSAVSPSNPLGTLQDIPVAAVSGTIAPYAGSTNTTPIPWQIQVGSVLVIDRGTPQEETIVVEAITPPAGGSGPKLRAAFQREHNAGFTVNLHGNPGPQPYWDPNATSEKPVVPFWEQLN